LGRNGSLKILIEEGMVENAHAMGARFLAGLRQINSPVSDADTDRDH
jgi:hypothetical protein